jgi:hypothetical protein
MPQYCAKRALSRSYKGATLPGFESTFHISQTRVILTETCDNQRVNCTF